MVGFYRSGFMQDGEKKWMVVTQFEACDARRAFPCWDEPAVKSKFTAILRVDKSLTALSNTLVTSEEVVGGLKVVKFATTPIMSTYLVAFAVGELEYVEDIAKPTVPKGAEPIRCRVYTNKGEKEQGRFALEIAVKTLEFFSKYYDCTYALPKVLSMLN
jgi:aminopeptidase 2